MQLAYLHGEPSVTGSIRNSNQDFFVEEQLGFEPSGQGEHVWIWVEKSGQNTQFVADKLAHAFGISPRQVSYSGMKDRNAITRQWFSLPFPIKKPVPVKINIEGCQLLKVTRHDKKLKTGTHKANLFKLNIKCGSWTEQDKQFVVSRIEQIKTAGVLNYFGEQRFGRDFGNIDKARKLFAGQFKVKDKRKRGIYFSAARSHIFNAIVDERVKQALLSPQQGEAFMLAGSNSIFTEDQLTDELVERYNKKDILITAAMWGDGELRSSGDIAELESKIAEANSDLANGLVDARLKQERRGINLYLPDINCELLDDGFTLSFNLPTGSFATSVLREIVNYSDASQSTSQQ